jgi:excisionase family DNA binding protein
MSVRQAAEALGESLRTTMRRIESGTLPAEKIDGKQRVGMYVIARADVDKLVAERAAELRAEVERLESSAAS